MRLHTNMLAGAAFAAALSTGTLFATPACAHHAGDMLVASTADGGGHLTLEFPFSQAIAVSFSATIGPDTIYTVAEPGFDSLDADEPGEGLWMLDDLTPVTVELTYVEPGRTSMILNSTPLDTIGDSVLLGTAPPTGDLHHHPTLQLVLTLPVGEYGTGLIGFKLTTTSGAYTQSDEFFMTLSNAHLAPIEYDGVAYDAASVKCVQSVGKEVKKAISSKYGLLAKCLDKIAVLEAKEAAGQSVTSAENAVDKACGADLLAKYGEVGSKAEAKINQKCGATGSNDLGANDVKTHLDFASCKAEELAGASYGGAKGLLEGLFGEGVLSVDVADQLSCLGTTGN